MGGGGGWGVLKQQHKSRSFCLFSGGGGEGWGGQVYLGWNNYAANLF